MYLTILKVVLILILGVVLALGFINYRTQHSPMQERFLQGRVPNPEDFPDGAYDGYVTGFPTGPWLGKTFDRDAKRGFNLIQDGAQVTEQFPFKTRAATGIVDKELSVIKVDYDIPENPFWLRFALDEIVQESPTHYLGKVHLKLPGISFALGFFELELSHN